MVHLPLLLGLLGPDMVTYQVPNKLQIFCDTSLVFDQKPWMIKQLSFQNLDLMQNILKIEILSTTPPNWSRKPSPSNPATT